MIGPVRPCCILCATIAALPGCAPDPASKAAPVEGQVADASMSAGSAEQTVSGNDAADVADGDRASLTLEETGWLTISADGAIQTTFLDADGTYRDFRGGELLAQGAWRRGADDALCFEPKDRPRACWTIGAIDRGGTAVAVNGEGRGIRITRVDYAAPDNAAERADDSAPGQSEG